MTSPPALPPVQYVELPDVRLAYYDTSVGEGPPVLFSHGFPELAYSWRHQLAGLAAAGRRAIALDQRGYGLSSRPEAVDAYDIAHLTGDLIGLLDHLKIDRAVLCGHDWGGIVVWQAPLRHPGRIAGVIALNTPFMPRAPADPIEIMRRRFGDEMYIVHFQKPGEADAILAADVGKTFNFFMKRPMRGARPATGGLRLTDPGAARPPGRSEFDLINMLGPYDPKFDPRETFLATEELAFFVETFHRTGFTGGINWYRNFNRNWNISKDIKDRVEVPSLMVMAELDAVLPPSAADGMEAYVPDLAKVLIKGSGHWTQQEMPQEVNGAILRWLEERF